MNTEPTVFIIDDDLALRKSLRWILESAGLTVRLYKSPLEFLEEFNTNTSGCVIVDLRMPGMGGLELQRQLSEQENAIPIIFLSGFGDVQTAVRAMQLGATDFLEKPVSDKHLLDQVRRSLADDAKNRANRKKLLFVRDQIAKLSNREREVMWLVVEGLTSRQISAQLGISSKTVEAHRARVKEKMASENVVELIKRVEPLRKELATD